MEICEICDPFKKYDALVILTRQGVVMTSNDALLTFAENAELYRLNKIITERIEKGNDKRI